MTLLLPWMASGASAQTHSLTWRGAPLSHTKSFLITECGYSFRLSQNSAPRYGGNRNLHVEWELGWMKNVSPKWAVGATSYFSADDDGSRLALKPRVRRWLSPTLSFDMSAGPIVKTFNSLNDDAPGLTLGVALMKRDLVGITLTYEQIPFTQTDRLPSDEFVYTKGTERVMYAGLRLGSQPGTVVGVAIPVGLIIWLFSVADD